MADPTPTPQANGKSSIATLLTGEKVWIPLLIVYLATCVLATACIKPELFKDGLTTILVGIFSGMFGIVTGVGVGMGIQARMQPPA